MSCVSISTSSIVSAILFVWVVCMLCCSINRCWRKVEEDACFTRRACPTRSIRAPHQRICVHSVIVILVL
jgi:hypothetical protein